MRNVARTEPTIIAPHQDDIWPPAVARDGVTPAIVNIVRTDSAAPSGTHASRQAMRYEANKKSAGIAYVLWFFLTVLGAHRFYLRRTASAVIMLLLSLTVLGLAITIPWVVLDAFLIPGMTRKYNNELINMLT